MRRVAMGLIGAALMLCLTACAGPVQPNAVDVARGEAMLETPPFDAETFGGEWRLDPARERTSANITAYRAVLWTEFPLPSTMTDTDTTLNASWRTTWPAAKAIYGEALTNGWQPIAVSCEPPPSTSAAGTVGSISVSMVHDIDGLVTATTIDVGGPDADVSARVATPFHTESDDPWATPVLDEPNCLDAVSPPLSGESAGGSPQLSDVPPS